MDLSELEKEQLVNPVIDRIPGGGVSVNRISEDSPPDGHQVLKAIYAPIASELASVEAILKRELQSKTPFVDQLLEHSWLIGGKRIRPVFLLLSGASCGVITDDHLKMAASLEMVHTATLIHDDVLDSATTRRHRASANSKWGNKTSVLLGDYLFTHAFHLASRTGSNTAIQLLARSSNQVCEGEMLQTQYQGNFELSQSTYMEMITEKTGELCGVGCQIGAVLSGSSELVSQRFERYGRNLGIAFQIIDDILDLVGTQQEVGKTLGTDLINQKPTLPIIHCLQHSESLQQQLLKQVLMEPDATASDVLPFLRNTGSIEYSRSVARNCAKSATEFAQSLEQNPNSVALQKLAEFVLQRTF